MFTSPWLRGRPCGSHTALALPHTHTLHHDGGPTPSPPDRPVRRHAATQPHLQARQRRHQRATAGSGKARPECGGGRRHRCRHRPAPPCQAPGRRSGHASRRRLRVRAPVHRHRGRRCQRRAVRPHPGGRRCRRRCRRHRPALNLLSLLRRPRRDGPARHLAPGQRCPAGPDVGLRPRRGRGGGRRGGRHVRGRPVRARRRGQRPGSGGPGSRAGGQGGGGGGGRPAPSGTPHRPESMGGGAQGPVPGH